MRDKRTSVQGVRQFVNEVGQTGNHLDLADHISVDAITPFEDIQESFLDLGWGNVIRIEVVGLRLSLHFLRLVRLIISATNGEF